MKSSIIEMSPYGQPSPVRSPNGITPNARCSKHANANWRIEIPLFGTLNANGNIKFVRMQPCLKSKIG